MAHDDDLDTVGDFKNIESNIEDVTIARITEEALMEMSAESLRFKSWTTFRISLIMFVQGCNQAGYGIDWAVINGINSYAPWHEYFGFGTSGATLGTINALMTIGNIVGAPFVSLADVIGRRGVNFLGNAIVLIASLMQGLAPNLKVFMAGRFFLGFGSAIMSTPQYMGEVAPTHLRGRLVGVFGACFQVGSLIMSGAMIGFGKLDNNLSWRIPLLLEGVFPLLVCLLIYPLTPESPRYLLLRGRKEEAKMVIARYQTTEGDNPNHPLVNVVIQQMEESIEKDKVLNQGAVYDFRPLFKKNGGRYRLLCLLLYSIFQQWNGGGIVSQYLTPALNTIGITDTLKLTGFQFGSVAVYFVGQLIGSFIVDSVNRRTLIFTGLITFIVLQTAATITSWQYLIQLSRATSILTVLWMFVFQACSSILIATMHNLYPVELLSLTLRAKGMAMYGLIQGAAGTVNNYGISVGINKLGYKIWVVYIVYNTIQLILAYFIFPETRGLSLEEIDVVFETPGVRPVKLSKDIMKARKLRQKLEAEGGLPREPPMVESTGREL